MELYRTWRIWVQGSQCRVWWSAPVCGWKQQSQEVSRCHPVGLRAAFAGSRGKCFVRRGSALWTTSPSSQSTTVTESGNHLTVTLNTIVVEATHLKKSDSPNSWCSKDLKEKLSYQKAKLIYKMWPVHCCQRPEQQLRQKQQANLESVSAFQKCLKIYQLSKKLSLFLQKFPPIYVQRIDKVFPSRRGYVQGTL